VNNNNNITWLVFAEDWGALPSASQHIIRQAMLNNPEHRFIWCDSIAMRKPRIFSGYDIKRAYTKVKHFLARKSKPKLAKKRHDNLLNLSLLVIPLWNFSVVAKINGYLIKKQLAKHLGKSDVWVYSSLPIVGAFVVYLKSFQKLIYYCGDDFAALANVDNKVATKYENILLSNCDHVFCASESLVNKHQEHNAVLLEHGIADYFIKHDSKRKKPSDLESINSDNIMLFYGSMEGWIDQQLLYKIADNTKWDIVILSINKPKVKHKKIHHLGYKNHSVLPAYMDHVQALILPFVNNQQIKNCNPLKLREYISSGKKIFSTVGGFSSAVDKFLTLIDHDNYQEILEKYHHKQDDAQQQQSIILDSWYNRYKALMACIDNHDQED
jgi:hypothetical protein